MTALDNVEAVVVPGPRFRDFLERRPGVAMQLLKLANDRMRNADRTRVRLAAGTARERFAQLLLDLTTSHGRHTEEGTDLTMPLTQQELAASIGASREVIQRLLRDFRERGVVTTRRRTLTVLRPDILRRLAASTEDPDRDNRGY